MRILIVDNDLDNANFTKEQIEALGHKAFVVELSPYYMNKALEKYKIDVVLFEIYSMGICLFARSNGCEETPTYFGLEVLREENGIHPREKGVCFIVFSICDIFVPGSAVARKIRTFVNQGIIDGHVVKPFIPERSMPKIEEIFFNFRTNKKFA